MIAPLAPGFSPERLCALMRQAIASMHLDLTGITILTEAASGAYGVTPVIAALAKAQHVHAVTRSSRYGSTEEVATWTRDLALKAGVSDRISVSESVSPDILPDVNLVTNSGHLRPITSTIIHHLPARSVIALMFEAWEFRSQDIDAAACRRRGIPVIGVNEHHAAVDVFSYLGPLCVKLLQDAGLSVYRNRIAVLCDNGFDEPILRGLTGLRADVRLVSAVEALHKDDWDAILVALQPGFEPRIGLREASYLASICGPGTVIVQLWGDMDRRALADFGLPVWPPSSPPRGHMAILLSAIGPDPIVRLQTGGLRAAEWVFRGGAIMPDGFAQLVDLDAIVP
ncbi:MAG TPA: hypothetical protein VIT21_06665 [Chthoniobacterales bacterium]